MKKAVSLFVCFVLIFCSLGISSVAAETIKCSVDAKPEGSYKLGEDKLNIKGWAFDTGGVTVRCYYRIDNGAEIMATPVVRNDVVSAFPGQCVQTDCGFDQYISVDNLSFGTHTFLFYAKNDSEINTLCETSFNVIGIKSDCNLIPSGTYQAENASDFNVVGWAFNSSGENTDYYYQIDDNSEIAMPHKNRNDVLSAFPDICKQLDCGFNYYIPFYEFPIGHHTLRLIAKSGGTSKTIASSEITVTGSADFFKYSADNNLSGTYMYGYAEPLLLSGWAFSPSGNEVRCYYSIDNGEYTLLTPSVRNDVKNAFSDICTQNDCGYHMNITVENLDKGIHKYKVLARCGNVSQVIKETEFNIVDSDGELKSHSDHIPEGSYSMAENCYALIQGWGYNTSAEEAKFYGKFDDGDEFYLTGEERVDVYNAQTGCFRKDCGYNRDIYLGNLTEGTHTCTVIMKSGGKSKTVKTSTFSISKPDCAVSFNANGGNGAPSQITKHFGKNIVIPTSIPHKDYYCFVGWNTSPDGSGKTFKAGENYTENSAAVLYAVWKHEEIKLASDSTLSFDAKNKLIYGESLLNMGGDELKKSFVNTNKTVSSSDIVTGTEISIFDTNGIYDTAQTVILGDVNCDGKTDGMDSVIALCIAEGMLKENQISPASYSAADCLRDGKVNHDDVQFLASAGLMLDSISQNTVASREYYDTDFTVPMGQVSSDKVMFNGKETSAEISSGSDSLNILLNAECDEFNFFGIKYSSDAYAKGTITYKVNGTEHSEAFFLEPAENGTFFSFIDGVFDDFRASHLTSICFTPLNSNSLNLSVSGIAVFNRETPERVSYIQNSFIKIGVDMSWGGALSYYEDLDSDVQAVSDNGIIRIDTDASQRYGTESLNDRVNLINCHDTGRLVQQSYYGTTNYEMGFYDGHYCAYNPVQGGNMYNDSSKIVDLRIDENSIYVKCRPLDWAKEKEYITDSYMEATYTLCDETLKTQCRFVDFSGYDPASRGQELPAFYGAATMDNFVYYGGNEPWTDGELSTLDGLDEYLYAHYPSVKVTEHWGALTGKFSDSFSIGLYIPDSEHMLAGVYGTVTEQTENPDISNPTSYLAGEKEMLFQSFDPIEYDFYITTGTVNEVRNKFKKIARS